MPKGYKRRFCIVCQRPLEECGTLSARGKCQECRVALQAANIIGLATHSGPFFYHWRRQMAASVGGALVDDARNAE
jgi:hypothetical protein